MHSAVLRFAVSTRLLSFREDFFLEQAVTSLAVCAGLRAISQHTEEAAEAQGLCQHDKLQLRWEIPPLRS